MFICCGDAVDRLLLGVPDEEILLAFQPPCVGLVRQVLAAVLILVDEVEAGFMQGNQHFGELDS